MNEQRVCDQCKNPETPLTEANSQEIFRRDGEGKKVIHAVIHRTCADAWALEHSAILEADLRP